MLEKSSSVTEKHSLSTGYYKKDHTEKKKKKKYIYIYCIYTIVVCISELNLECLLNSLISVEF